MAGESAHTKVSELKGNNMFKRIKWVLFCLVFVPFLVCANDTANTPVRIDTFGADVTISSTRVWIENMTITAYTSAKTITFIDADDAVVLVLECPAGYTITWPPANTREPKEFPNGLYFDDSASDLATNDYIFIWKSVNGR